MEPLEERSSSVNNGRAAFEEESVNMCQGSRGNERLQRRKLGTFLILFLKNIKIYL